MNTNEIRDLVEEVLRTNPDLSRDPHVINQVFVAIEKNPAWLERYECLVKSSSPQTVNARGGYYIAEYLGRSGSSDVQEKATSGLIKSYTVLDRDIPATIKRPQATQMMADYYKAHRDMLPDGITQYREDLIKLIMGGNTPEEAFKAILNLHFKLPDGDSG